MGRSLAGLSVASARAIFLARAMGQAAAVVCTASIVGSAVAQSSGASVPQGICTANKGYLIVDGVHRAKAHHVIGRGIVIATVVNQGYIVQGIPLDMLYSPKTTIPDWMRFNKILEKVEEVGAGGAAPIAVQQVLPPIGTPIRDVKVLGPRGRPIYH